MRSRPKLWHRPYRRVAGQFEVSREMVRKWRSRFLQGGIDGRSAPDHPVAG
jgi:transposase-like protein